MPARVRGGGTAATTQMMMWVLAIDSTGMQSTESGVAHQGVLAGAKAYGRDAGLHTDTL